MILRGYFDLSRNPTDGLSVIGGHIGDAETWQTAEQSWQECLDYWELDWFHLTEIPAIFGHEKGSDCIKNFCRAVPASLIGIVAGMQDSSWQAAIEDEPKLKAEFPSQYHALCHMLFDLLADVLANFKSGSLLHITLDKDHSDTEFTEAVFDYWKQKSDSSLCSLSFGSQRKQKPMQMADLISGLQRKQWEEYGFVCEATSAPPEAASPDYMNNWTNRAFLAARGRIAHLSMWSTETAKQRQLGDNPHSTHILKTIP